MAQSGARGGCERGSDCLHAPRDLSAMHSHAEHTQPAHAPRSLPQCSILWRGRPHVAARLNILASQQYEQVSWCSIILLEISLSCQ